MAHTFRVSRALEGAATRRHASSSVTPVACGYERSLRPSLACVSRLERTTYTEGVRS